MCIRDRYKDEREHVIYNMVNGLLLRPYMSGMVWDMGEESLELMREGISLYKEIRDDVKKGVPVFPLGFTDTRDDVLAYAIKTESKTYLAVFTPKTDKAEIPLAAAGITGDVYKRQIHHNDIIVFCSSCDKRHMRSPTPCSQPMIEICPNGSISQSG